MAKAGVPVSATNPSQHQPLDSTNLIKGSAPQSDLTGPTAPVAGATEERRSPASGPATGKPEQQGSNGAVAMTASDESTADTIKEDKRSESTPVGGGPPASETNPEETGDKKSPLNGGGSSGSPGAAPATAGTPPAVTASQAASSGNNSNSSNVNNSNSSNSTSNKNDHKERDEKGDPLARNGANNNNGSGGGLSNATAADASLETLGKQKQQQANNSNGNTASAVAKATTAGAKENR